MEALSLLVMPSGVLAGAVLVALVWDRVFGEPPARIHPVVWMGHYLTAVGQRVSRPVDKPSRPATEFLAGALAWCLGAALVLGLAVAGGFALEAWHPMVQALVLGCLLKPLLAWRMLRDEVRAVEAALAESLEAGRQRVGWLVSRDVSSLSEAEVREAALSTLAENLNDSVVAPIFWFAVAGLPGAALYRYANTADAMWGYLGARAGRDWTWAGKCAARVDDVLSWVPARLTAALLWLAGMIHTSPSARGVKQPGPFSWALAVPREAAATPSPNGGWPMATMALSLGVRLGKPGVYVLNELGAPPAVADTSRALALSGRVVGWLALAAVGVTWSYFAGNFA